MEPYNTQGRDKMKDRCVSSLVAPNKCIFLHTINKTSLLNHNKQEQLHTILHKRAVIIPFIGFYCVKMERIKCVSLYIYSNESEAIKSYSTKPNKNIYNFVSFVLNVLRYKINDWYHCYRMRKQSSESLVMTKKASVLNSDTEIDGNLLQYTQLNMNITVREHSM